MSIYGDASRSLPFLAGFSAKDRQLAERALRDYDKRRQEAGESLNRKAGAIVEAARRKAQDLVGAKDWPGLRLYLQRERLALRDLGQPPGGLGLDRRKANEARVKKGDAYLRKLGVNPKQLREIGKDAQERLQDLLTIGRGKVVPGHHTGQHLKQWTSLSPLHKFPLPWGGDWVIGPVDDPHRWFLFQPPFFGFNFHFVKVASSNFQVDRDHILSPPAGLVGNDATMTNNDPDDIDYASADVVTQIAFAFEAPTTGLVEVLIDAQSFIATHHLETEDNWGWSNSTTLQENYLMLEVLHPSVLEPSLAEMSRFSLKTDEDTSNDVENLTRGQHYFAQLFSAGPVLGGQTIIVLIGTRSFDKSGTDDVEIRSRSSFHWLIRSVEVRISP